MRRVNDYVIMLAARLVQCPECYRRFDLNDEFDAEEFHYGHDCDEDSPKVVCEKYGHNLVPDAMYCDMCGEEIE